MEDENRDSVTHVVERLRIRVKADGTVEDLIKIVESDGIPIDDDELYYFTYIDESGEKIKE